MQRRIFLQMLEYNSKRYEYCKNIKTLPFHYIIICLFSGINDEVVYIIVSIKIHVGQDMDSGQYYCGVLDYNTGTWWRFVDYKITNFRGYPENVYD